MRAHLRTLLYLCLAVALNASACKSETVDAPVAAAQPPIKPQTPAPSAQNDAPGAGLAPKLTRDIDRAKADRLDLYRSYVNAIVTFAPNDKTGHELLKAMVPGKAQPQEEPSNELTWPIKAEQGSVIDHLSAEQERDADSFPPGASRGVTRPWVKSGRGGRIYEPARKPTPRYTEAGGDRLYDHVEKRHLTAP